MKSILYFLCIADLTIQSHQNEMLNILFLGIEERGRGESDT